MRLVYRNAQRVLVRLGNDVEVKAREAFALVCTIIQHWRLPPSKEIVDGFVEYNDKTSAATEGKLYVLPLVSASLCDCLNLLYSLSLFEHVLFGIPGFSLKV
jgi:hypothetical protein